MRMDLKIAQGCDAMETKKKNNTERKGNYLSDWLESNNKTKDQCK
jgi:hypothetical protein